MVDGSKLLNNNLNRGTKKGKQLDSIHKPSRDNGYQPCGTNAIATQAEAEAEAYICMPSRLWLATPSTQEETPTKKPTKRRHRRGDKDMDANTDAQQATRPSKRPDVTLPLQAPEKKSFNILKIKKLEGKGKRV